MGTGWGELLNWIKYWTGIYCTNSRFGEFRGAHYSLDLAISSLICQWLHFHFLVAPHCSLCDQSAIICSLSRVHQGYIHMYTIVTAVTVYQGRGWSCYAFFHNVIIMSKGNTCMYIMVDSGMTAQSSNQEPFALQSSIKNGSQKLSQFRS